jgi:hypothetical protein
MATRERPQTSARLVLLAAVGLIFAAAFVVYGGLTCGPKEKLASTWIDNLVCETKASDIAIVWLTYCLILVGYFQAHWLQETVRVAADAAAAQSNDTRIIQRAYIAVEPLGVFRMFGQDKVIGHVGMKNAGHLPAEKMGWAVDIKLSTSAQELDFPIYPKKGSIVLAPGAVAIRGSGSHLLIPDLQRRADSGPQQLYLYVWGIVWYHDGFTEDRITRFCHRYNWESHGIGTEEHYFISDKFARYHEYGNEAT